MSDLINYQDWVESVSTARTAKNLTYGGLGISGEAGEVTDRIKKIYRADRQVTEDDRLYLMLELGDVLWYLAKICNALDISMEEVLWTNMEKINGRAGILKP